MFVCSTMGVVAKQDITVEIIDGISNRAVKERMEISISMLLSEINQACAQERSLELDNIDMELSGKRSLQYLWENLHFLCEDNVIKERCLTSADGFAIRNIYIQVNPMIEDYQDERERALTIRLTSEGRVASVVMAASDEAYERIVSRGLSVTDLERRQTILGFVENFRSHYDPLQVDRTVLWHAHQRYANDSQAHHQFHTARRIEDDGGESPDEGKR